MGFVFKLHMNYLSRVSLCSLVVIQDFLYIHGSRNGHYSNTETKLKRPIYTFDHFLFHFCLLLFLESNSQYVHYTSV